MSEESINNKINNVIKTELSNPTAKLPNDYKLMLYEMIYKISLEIFDDEDFGDFSPQAQLKTIKIATNWIIKGTLLFLKLDIEKDFHPDVLEELVETILKVTAACLEGNFGKEEFSNILKEETKTALLVGISYLKDEEKIDDYEYEQISTRLSK